MKYFKSALLYLVSMLSLTVSLNVFAQCDGYNVVCNQPVDFGSSSSNLGAFMPGPTIPSGIGGGANEVAQRTAGAAIAKQNCLNSVTPIIAADIDRCKAEVDYKATLMRNQCSSWGGQVSWYFEFHGTIMTSIVDKAPVAYDGILPSVCPNIVNASAELTRTACKTDGEIKKQKICQF